MSTITTSLTGIGWVDSNKLASGPFCLHLKQLPEPRPGRRKYTSPARGVSLAGCTGTGIGSRGTEDIPEWLLDDLMDIAEWARLESEEPGVLMPPSVDTMFYTDGTKKPYTRLDSHVTMVRKAQAEWACTDGEVL